MGDRANILVIDEPRTESGIFLYTHSRGEEWPERLRLALKEAESRWDDPQYGVRVVVTSVFRDLDGGTTGGGMSTLIGDPGSYPLIVCNFVSRTVTIGAATWEDFSAYVDQPRADWPT